MNSLGTRIFLIIMAIVIAVELVLSLIMGWVLLDTQEQKTFEELKTDLIMLQEALSTSHDNSALIRSHSTKNVRITWIDASGNILYDSGLEGHSATENHRDRPEFIDAMSTGSGSATRFSSTLGEVTYYQAIRLDDGTVLRLSESQNHVYSLVFGLLIPAISILLLVAIIAATIARLLAQRVISPLLELDLDEPLSNSVYHEIEPLLDRIEDQRRRIITESERSLAERREFTANVSHELKTPLTVISGYAELMMNSQTRTEDIPHFSSLIHAETEHMRELVDDVLLLSQFDELNDKKPRDEHVELVDLRHIVTDCIDRLTPFADQQDISFHMEAEGLTRVAGVPRILTSMVFNLCENAIRYNRKGGRVNVSLTGTNEEVRLDIEDTGIGISQEDQQRVFERFYRVDRTRSRKTGGTGLGLAIVKHGASYHGAHLTLTSAPDVGTIVTVVFPAAVQL